jgi:hypothetical protein
VLEGILSFLSPSTTLKYSDLMKIHPLCFVLVKTLASNLNRNYVDHYSSSPPILTEHRELISATRILPSEDALSNPVLKGMTAWATNYHCPLQKTNSVARFFPSSRAFLQRIYNK